VQLGRVSKPIPKHAQEVVNMSNNEVINALWRDSPSSIVPQLTHSFKRSGVAFMIFIFGFGGQQ
jgi:hypothetical protein